MKNKVKLNLIELIILVTIPCLILSTLTGTIVYSKLNKTGKVTSTNNENVNQFINVYNELLEEYYEDLDENELVDAAISGMLSYAGDDYTIYMNQDATESLNSQLDGTYEGVGIRITLDEEGNMMLTWKECCFVNASKGTKLGEYINQMIDRFLEMYPAIDGVF
jgi:carboxyl-terminal processing protease